MSTNQDFEQIYALYRMQSDQPFTEGFTPNVGSVTQTNGLNHQDAAHGMPGFSPGGQEQIVAVRKNEDGDLIAFKTNSGRELDYLTALAEAKAGKLAHVDVFHKYGRDILRSEPDGIRENNLDELPRF